MVALPITSATTRSARESVSPMAPASPPCGVMRTSTMPPTSGSSRSSRKCPSPSSSRWRPALRRATSSPSTACPNCPRISSPASPPRLPVSLFSPASNNHCFLAESQQRTFDFFNSWRKGYHSLHIDSQLWPPGRLLRQECSPGHLSPDQRRAGSHQLTALKLFARPAALRAPSLRLLSGERVGRTRTLTGLAFLLPAARNETRPDLHLNHRPHPSEALWHNPHGSIGRQAAGRWSTAFLFKMPVYCRNSPALFAVFSIDADKARKLIPGNEIYPVRLWNKRPAGGQRDRLSRHQHRPLHRVHHRHCLHPRPASRAAPAARALHEPLRHRPVGLRSARQHRGLGERRQGHLGHAQAPGQSQLHRRRRRSQQPVRPGRHVRREDRSPAAKSLRGCRSACMA